MKCTDGSVLRIITGVFFSNSNNLTGFFKCGSYGHPLAPSKTKWKRDSVFPKKRILFPVVQIVLIRLIKTNEHFVGWWRYFKQKFIIPSGATEFGKCFLKIN